MARAFLDQVSWHVSSIESVHSLIHKYHDTWGKEAPLWESCQPVIFQSSVMSCISVLAGVKREARNICFANCVTHLNIADLAFIGRVVRWQPSPQWVKTCQAKKAFRQSSQTAQNKLSSGWEGTSNEGLSDSDGSAGATSCSPTTRGGGCTYWAWKNHMHQSFALCWLHVWQGKLWRILGWEGSHASSSWTAGSSLQCTQLAWDTLWVCDFDLFLFLCVCLFQSAYD